VELVGEGRCGGQRECVVRGKPAGARSASSTNPQPPTTIKKAGTPKTQAYRGDMYSDAGWLVGQMLSTRLYPNRVVVVADDEVVASHERLSNEGPDPL